MNIKNAIIFYLNNGVFGVTRNGLFGAVIATYDDEYTSQ